VVPGDSIEVWEEIHMNRGRVGEERRGKEMDGCPLTLPRQRPRIYGLACLILTSGMTASTMSGISMIPLIPRGNSKQKTTTS
jgi:hypothetical protein